MGMEDGHLILAVSHSRGHLGRLLVLRLAVLLSSLLGLDFETRSPYLSQRLAPPPGFDNFRYRSDGKLGTECTAPLRMARSIRAGWSEDSCLGLHEARPLIKSPFGRAAPCST